MKTTPSPDEIRAAATNGIGWKRATLAAWGVPWPPPKGWRAELERRWRAENTPGATGPAAGPSRCNTSADNGPGRPVAPTRTEVSVAPQFDPYVSPGRRAAQRRLEALDLVDFVDIAARLQVHEGTPSTWRVRGILPEPDLLKGGRGSTPLWLWLTIDEWARRTNRHPEQMEGTPA